MRHCPEIVDDGETVDAQPLLHQIGPDHPRIVGQFEDLATHRAGKSDRQLVREIDTGLPAEVLPGELEARMIGGLERNRFAKRDNPPALDLGERKTRVGSANVGDRNLPHVSSASITASIADAPASASLAV